MLSYVIRWEERLALKDCFLTADKERSQFETTIIVSASSLKEFRNFFTGSLDGRGSWEDMK